jgi:hypothetical protein
MLKVTSGAPMADGRDICGKTLQNSASQTISKGAIITAEALTWGSLLRHRNTLRICTAIASPVENWRLTEGSSSSGDPHICHPKRRYGTSERARNPRGYHLKTNL